MCSRRAAEVLISAGEVWVNSRQAELGQRIDPGTDKVTVRGKSVRAVPQPLLTLALNKPRGLVCSNDDPHNPDTIFDLLPRELGKFRFFCAGRLDKDSEGLVILTTDGHLAHRLMHPALPDIAQKPAGITGRLELQPAIGSDRELIAVRWWLIGAPHDGIDDELCFGRQRDLEIVPATDRAHLAAEAGIGKGAEFHR